MLPSYLCVANIFVRFKGIYLGKGLLPCFIVALSCGEVQSWDEIVIACIDWHAATYSKYGIAGFTTVVIYMVISNLVTNNLSKLPSPM